ncbi:GtrA family protein [Desulforamulus putei]|uniref:Putative flippase GtrA (Transmembrane translocase of bactoprenol-linked glucose) n=1 Tax=Desulforamulus putei DSM 12395 TaxID=1121429 RepID=A0A1M4WB35_9FIRM|nr:GtrA family protein [Desulforamulus putei]SHE78436.1 Putative flippase GtrA (transmembrane translocase of bactoprenol-linked glucose) [Desulforamulus putei DSM 12395]
MTSSDHAIKQNARSLVLFSLVGLSNTLIDYLVFFLLYHRFPDYYLAVQVISYCCGMINSYLLNKYWTFQKKNVPNRAELLKFVTVNALALSVTSITLFVVNHNFSLNMFICKTIATGMSLVVNYIGSKYWVFKDEKFSYAR